MIGVTHTNKFSTCFQAKEKYLFGSEKSKKDFVWNKDLKVIPPSKRVHCSLRLTTS